MTERPLPSWEGATAEELAGEWGVPVVHLFAEVGSTNDVARRLAGEGAPSRTLVLAERQTGGRGRAGRAWDSPGGVGLWMSWVLRPPGGAAPGPLPLRIGLAVAEALDPFAGVGTVRLKWPNDLLVADRKLGGILCEAVWERGAPSVIVAGIGLNVLHSAAELPDALRDSATSVALAAGGPVLRREVARAVVGSLVRELDGPWELTPAALGRLEGRDALRGREVVVTEPATGAALAVGTALGVAPDGSMLLRTPQGALRHVHSGTVRPLDTGRGASQPDPPP